MCIRDSCVALPLQSITAVLSSEQAGQTGGVSSPLLLSLCRAFGPHAALNAINKTRPSEVGSLIARTKTLCARAVNHRIEAKYLSLIHISEPTRLLSISYA